MTHDPKLVEAVARSLSRATHSDSSWPDLATAALDARDAWVAANAPFDGGTVTQSRLRKLRKKAADGQEGVGG
jgi:hypothetical protein